MGRYLLGLLPALAARGVAVRALSASLRDRFAVERLPGCEIVDRRVPVRALEWLWRRGRWPRFESLAGSVDVTHSPTPLPLPTRRAARVVTFHDLFFLDRPELVTREVRSTWARQLTRDFHLIDAAICVSRRTADRAAAHFPALADRLHVVHHGLEPRWRPPTGPLEDGPRVVLAVGTLEPRKNYVRLLSAFDRLLRSGERDLTLIIAGGEGLASAAIHGTIRRLGLGAAVRLVGYQSQRQLEDLYHRATLLAMPSLDEGFGFPVLEAMASGVPAVVASAGALPEVAGDAAEFVDPLDEESIFEGLHRVLHSSELREAMRRRGLERANRFSWENAARETARVYELALARSA